MSIRIGINGFGRIGRLVARLAAQATDVDLVAFNDLVDPATNAHLFKYDSTYGRFAGQVELLGDELTVNGDKIKLLKEKDPALIPWGDLGVDFVLESTGVFTNVEACAKHLAGGAKYVMLSAPAKGAMPTYVFGVNHENWVSDGKPTVISNASCTTNCLAPMAKVLHDNWVIQRGLMNTIHAYTGDQNILDRGHKDLRRARSAAVNVIPTTTGAAKAIGLVIPELKGKLDGFATRVPVVTGSMVDLTVQLEREASVEADQRQDGGSRRRATQGHPGLRDRPDCQHGHHRRRAQLDLRPGPDQHGRRQLRQDRQLVRQRMGLLQPLPGPDAFHGAIVQAQARQK